MAHAAKNFEYLIGQIKGLSERQLRNHFELYQGYVKKLNEIEEELKFADRSKANYSYAIFSELQRRHSVAFNGVYLHQLYFEGITEKQTKPTLDLETAINHNFGSMTQWLTDALASLKSVDGWVLLTRSRINGMLHTCVVEEHHKGLFVEQDILLAIDSWEHAYMIDYGVNKADYFKTIKDSIDWNIVSQRFQQSHQKVSIAA